MQFPIPDLNFYTSYFNSSAWKKDNILPIAISLSTPRDFKGFKYVNLAPTWDILNRYKKDRDEFVYREDFIKLINTRFTEEKGGISKFIKDAEELAKSKGKDTVVLLCYENKTKFCHRFIVMEFINKFYGMRICEEL